MSEAARTIIITGASSGIGEALARAAAAEGYRVLAVARRAERLAAVVSAIAERGGTAVPLTGDVTDETTPERIVATATSIFGRIDVVVNNAGGGAFGELLEQSDAEIDAQWRLNVLGPLRISRAALPALEATHGQLVFVGSGVARVPLPNYGAYSLAKAAIRAAAVQLRRELRERNVGVTYVDPGVVATEFHAVMGIERSRDVSAASPQRVARAMLRGIARRSAVVNAVPWQSAGSALGEYAGTLGDRVIAKRFGGKRLEAAP
ncbi:MAG TPA: SDR family NAD(P)-dependent oxidoreductase [Candidatus Cybelea sp.]|jgi:short-subunit dehydrogenase|nr:SDR family NAD(P)-dependent oxidoreductase [Candidatus Cybelea sp.]